VIGAHGRHADGCSKQWSLQARFPAPFLFSRRSPAPIGDPQMFATWRTIAARWPNNDSSRHEDFIRRRPLALGPRRVVTNKAPPCSAGFLSTACLRAPLEAGERIYRAVRVFRCPKGPAYMKFRNGRSRTRWSAVFVARPPIGVRVAVVTGAGSRAAFFQRRN